MQINTKLQNIQYNIQLTLSNFWVMGLKINTKHNTNSWINWLYEDINCQGGREEIKTQLVTDKWSKWSVFYTVCYSDKTCADHKWHMWHATISQVSLSMHLSCEWTLCPNQCKSYWTTISNANDQYYLSLHSDCQIANKS